VRWARHGAAVDCVRSSAGIEIVAMGDLFPDRIAAARAEVAKLAAEDAVVAAGFRVTDDHTFSGFDAYRKVIDSDVDLVILATPPGFRPAHFATAVAAGRHVFMEKPVAVDPTGVRSVLATTEVARQQGLAIVAAPSGATAGYRAAIERAHDGARRAGGRPGVLEPGRAVAQAATAGVVRHRVADP
jgi:predicted dehydrogenase